MAIEVVVERAAGLDIGKASLTACGCRAHAVAGGCTSASSTMTAQLLELAGWLAGHGVTRVGMESTSEYWMNEFVRLAETYRGHDPDLGSRDLATSGRDTLPSAVQRECQS